MKKPRQKTPHLVLYVDCHAKHNSFCICDKNGKPVNAGFFQATDEYYTGEQWTGQLSVALRAIDIALAVRKEVLSKKIILTIYTDAEWLKWANDMSSGQGGKAKILGRHAWEHSVKLDVKHHYSDNNPARKYSSGNLVEDGKGINLEGLLA